MLRFTNISNIALILLFYSCSCLVSLIFLLVIMEIKVQLKVSNPFNSHGQVIFAKQSPIGHESEALKVKVNEAYP